MTFAYPLLLALVGGCDLAADLPAGWEDARHIDDFTQGECDGYAGDTGEVPTVTATADAGLRVVGDNLTFPCSTEVEGFYRSETLDIYPVVYQVSVLVQPVDMDPYAVAGCDCLYRVEAGIPEDPESATVYLYTRQGSWTDENDPELVGSAADSRPEGRGARRGARSARCRRVRR